MATMTDPALRGMTLLDIIAMTDVDRRPRTASVIASRVERKRNSIAPENEKPTLKRVKHKPQGRTPTVEYLAHQCLAKRAATEEKQSVAEEKMMQKILTEAADTENPTESAMLLRVLKANKGDRKKIRLETDQLGRGEDQLIGRNVLVILNNSKGQDEGELVWPDYIPSPIPRDFFGDTIGF